MLLVRRLGLSIALGLAGVGAFAAVASASPGIVDPGPPVIPPGREPLALALLADVPDHATRQFGGPTIQADSIVFELYDGETLLASLRLEPVGNAQRGEPTSESFVIRSTLADGVAPETVAAPIDAATASVQAHDHGGFYVHAEATPRVDAGSSETEAAPLPEPDVAGNRTLWAIQTGLLASLLIGGGVLAVRTRKRSRAR